MRKIWPVIWDLKTPRSCSRRAGRPGKVTVSSAETGTAARRPWNLPGFVDIQCCNCGRVEKVRIPTPCLDGFFQRSPFVEVQQFGFRGCYPLWFLFCEKFQVLSE